MGSINPHQSAGFCAQPEATQDNPQNLSTARTTVAIQFLPDPFFPTHARKKKSGLAMRDY